MAPIDQGLPSSSKPRPPQVEVEPYRADWHKASAKKAVTKPIAETEDNKVGENIQYFYSEEYKRRWSSGSTRRRRRTDRRVIKKVRFSLDNVRVQSAYLPSNQFRFPTKKERQEWAVLRPRKRNHIEEKSTTGANPTTKKKKNKRKQKKKKKDEDKDHTPNLKGEAINNTEQKSVNENETVDKQLTEERRVNIVLNDPNLGFLLQPVAGRYKAMVAQVTKHLMETEKLYPGMRVCSIENKPISPTCSFAEVQAMIEQLKTPTLIGFVDVYKNRCKICLRGFLKYDQMVVHMAEHKQQQQHPEVEQVDQRKRWLMNLQMQNPLMYQQYVIQHQISRLQAHIESIKPNPALQAQRLQAEAHMDLLKNQLISLSHQQRTSMLQKQQGPGLRSQGQASSSLGAFEMSTTENTASTATTSHNPQLTNTSRTSDVLSGAKMQQVNSEQATSAANINNTSAGHLESKPTNKDDAREDRNIQIALSQLAALKQIYTRSPQTAIAQLAGLLQMAEKNEVAVSQLRNLQEAAKRDAELAGLFTNLQKTAFSVLQRHIARQKVSKENASQLQEPSKVQALKRNEKKPKKN